MPPIANPDIYPGIPGTTLYAGIATPASGTLVTSFTLENWDSVSSTRTLFRGGMPFAKGDVPSGSVPVIKRGETTIAAQFDERSTWSDGSLKFAVCHLRDDNLAASTSAVYDVYSVSGSFDNTGATTLASVASSDAITVEFSSLTQYNGTTNVTRGAGAALAAFADHAAVGTRVTKIHSGPVCEGWQVWGMAKDGAAGAGSEDAHLKVIWHVDVWKNASGAVIDTEFAAEIAQDWWAVPGKFRLDYTATLKRNGATVQAYTGVQHPYHAHWMTVQMQDDNNHAKRHWVGDTPTLTYLFDKDYWVSTKLAPPLDTALSPVSWSKATYIPAKSMGHRATIDDTGAYAGRGVISVFDVVAFMRQTPFDTRNARTNAFAGLHIPYHFRDERNRTRPTESADVANTLVPLRWIPKADAASTFAGLPTPKHAYRGGVYNNIADRGAYVDPVGGTGVWAVSVDSSHAPQTSMFAYMLEGERYMWEAMVSNAVASAQNQNAGQFGGMPWLHWYGNEDARAETSIPSLQWTGIPAFTSQGNERSVGWAVNLLAGAAGLAPDNDPQGQYIKDWNAHCADYLNECVTYQPPSAKQAGQTSNEVGAQANLLLHWMSGFVVMGLMQNKRMTEESSYDSYASMVLNGVVGLASNSLYNLNNYYSLTKVQIEPYSSSHTYFTPSQLMAYSWFVVSSNVATLGNNVFYPLQNNDEVYFVRNEGRTLPSGFTEGVKLYVVSADNNTCRLSLTPGGAPVSIPNGTYSIGLLAFGASATAATFPPYLPPPDSFLPISSAALVYAKEEGLPGATTELVNKVIAFQVNMNFADDPRWKMKLVSEV